jgi:hypothetical protein
MIGRPVNRLERALRLFQANFVTGSIDTMPQIGFSAGKAEPQAGRRAWLSRHDAPGRIGEAWSLRSNRAGEAKPQAARSFGEASIGMRS